MGRGQRRAERAEGVAVGPAHKKVVEAAGFEPALSSTPSLRIARLSHALSVSNAPGPKSLVGESNPPLRLERAVSLPIDERADQVLMYRRTKTARGSRDAGPFTSIGEGIAPGVVLGFLQPRGCESAVTAGTGGW